LLDVQPRDKQVQMDQLQYELSAVRRRTDTEVSSLRQRVADLELQVTEARKEADEYYRASVEHNTEATALANQVTYNAFVTAAGFSSFWSYSSTCISWWRGTVVERRSLAGELSLSCARPAADG